jgi:hypothetical protein
MSSKPQVTLTLAGDERRLSKSIDATESKFKSMADAVERSSKGMADAADKSMGQTKKATEEAGQSFEKFHQGVSSGTAKVVASAAVIGLSFADALGKIFEQADVGGLLAAKLGGGAERAGQLGALAGKIYADNFGESVSDVGEALQGVIGSNLVNEDAADADIKRVTERLITVGQVVGESTSRVSTAVSQMLRTGLAKSAEEAFDLIVRAQQQGVNKSEDLLDTLNEYGTQFRKLGLDGPQALGLISQAIKGGARDADTAADALKEFSIRALDVANPSTVDGFKSLGLSTSKMAAAIGAGGAGASAALDTVLDRLRKVKDPADLARISVDLFGTKAEDLGAALGRMDLSTAVDEMGKVKGATDDAMTAIGDTPGAKFESFKRHMESELIDTLNKAAPLLEQFGQFVSDNIDILLPMAGIIAGITAAQWLWNAAVAANPWVLLIELLAGVVAAIIILWNKNESFRLAITFIWQHIRDAIVGTIEWIKSVWNGLIDFFGASLSRVGRVLDSLAGIVSGAFKATVNAVVDALNWALDHSINWVINQANSITSIVGGSHIPTIPHIPRMHTGGPVTGGLPGQEVLRILQAGETVNVRGQGGDGAELRVTGNGGLYEAINYGVRRGEIQLVR